MYYLVSAVCVGIATAIPISEGGGEGGIDDYYNGAEFIIISEIESLPTKAKDNTLYIGPARRRSHRAGGGSVFGDGGGG